MHHGQWNENEYAITIGHNAIFSRWGDQNVGVGVGQVAGELTIIEQRVRAWRGGVWEDDEELEARYWFLGEKDGEEIIIKTLV